MGQELAALGFNLYLGLSLDVLTLPNTNLNADLNTRVFGGDPYWVGEMGRAYISGLHGGSAGGWRSFPSISRAAAARTVPPSRKWAVCGARWRN